jgi:outer membrane protein assembly factor BamB
MATGGWPRAAGLAAACVLGLGACGAASRSAGTAGAAGASLSSRVAGDGDWTRFDFDAARSGVDPSQTGITTADLPALSVRELRLDGVVDSSAVQLHDVRVRGRVRDVDFVTTTYGRTIAFDPATAAKLWEYVPRDIARYEGSAQVTTATPVLDSSRRYLFAASPDGLIHKLAVSSGREVRSGHWPARVTFDATHEKIGGALNLSGRLVLAVTGGYIGDAPTYQGHVAAIDRRSGRIVHVWNSLCSTRHRLIRPPRACPVSDSAIWARAGAVVIPGSRRILVSTGNGPWNGSTNWGDSVLELTPDAGRLLQNWTPRDQRRLELADTDVGSTAPAVLPELGGRRLAVQGGKAGALDLLDLSRLNGTGRAGRRLGGELAQIATPGAAAMFTAPVVWHHGGATYVFVADSAGTSAYVLAGRSRPRLRVRWHTALGASSPVLAGGLLYLYNAGDGGLNVIDPVTGSLRRSLPTPSGHWNSPIVTGGRIILPVGGDAGDRASSGLIEIFHLPGR